MIKLLTVIGARPQIIKAAAISRAIKKKFSDTIVEKILHTGQHYDTNMSQVFFDELGIPAPDYNLGVGSGSHGEQTAKMISRIEQVLLSEHFDGVILYGDTNSTLAGAVAAAKIHIPVFHIEAGLRSYNMAMPEEQNRIVCDQLSSILFAPTQTAVDNLAKEGFIESAATFANGRGRQVVKAGDVMYDNSMFFSRLLAESCSENGESKESQILNSYGVTSGDFVLATIHRDNNTDYPERLSSIFRALIDIAENNEIDVVLPLHPRTKKILEKNLCFDLYQRVKDSPRMKLVPPASFFEIMALEKNAKFVMTDSGGVQKEAFFFERPCIILRPETEWVEIVEHGAGILADADYDRIISAYDTLAENEAHFPKLFGDSHSAEKILYEIVLYLS